MYYAFLIGIQRRVILNKKTLAVRHFFPQNKNKQSIHAVLETCIRGLSSDVVRNRRMYSTEKNWNIIFYRFLNFHLPNEIINAPAQIL